MSEQLSPQITCPRCGNYGWGKHKIVPQEGKFFCMECRNTFEVDPPPEDGKCEACGVEGEDLEYYDNQIHGPSGWFCWECIKNSEMEL